MKDRRVGEDENVRINLYFSRTRNEGEYTVSIGAGWFPPRLLPLFDAQFESAPVLLDLEHLQRTMEREGASCTLRVTGAGSRELTAVGDNALTVARWLESAMSSGLVKR